jgi:predicted dehydrogenase
VSGSTTTFVAERPLPGAAAERGDRTGTVTVDDAAMFTARLGSGQPGGATVGTFEVTRFAAGRKNALRIELNGELGSLAFDLERLNELDFHDHGADPLTAGFRRILVTEPGHPYLSAWWPPGHVLGWDVTFTHEVADLVTAIAAGAAPQPSFAAGLQVQRVLAAVQESAANASAWITVPSPGH